MNQKILIESLSMDLLRVAMGLQRGSLKMAGRFRDEALKRKKEINMNEVEPYVAGLLLSMEKKALDLADDRTAEDMLMYSTLFRNYGQRRMKYEKI